MFRVVALGVALALSIPARARAEEAAPADPAVEVTPGRRALAITAALVPGVIVHGAGSWVAGERTTARRLASAQLAGLALAVAGGLPVGLSGGAAQTMPGLALILPGGGLLVTTWLADIYAAAGGERLGGRPAPPARLEAALGYTFVRDADLPIAHLAAGEATVRVGRAAAQLAAWAGDGAWRARLAAGARLYGPRPDAPAADATAIDVEAGFAHEDRDVSSYAVRSGELIARGRYDLVRLAAPLAGSFATLGLGLGVEQVRYATGAADTGGLVAGRFGWGVYLGAGAGEVELYYEHRRDTLAGGLTPRLPFNGFFGHVGAAASGWRGAWGLAAGLEIGSAYVATLALRWRTVAP
ncbi:MAG TPA: hypothetical protein VM734_21060 [Kofleriaceae bacterium]|nr:hypothetical protein [Kofleriaceae bacterium]